MNRSTFVALALLSAFSLRAADAVPAGYPLKTCVVSDEELGSMGKPFEVIYKVPGKPDRKVLLCCSSCEDDFFKDPAKALAKLDAAEQAAEQSSDRDHKK